MSFATRRNAARASVASALLPEVEAACLRILREGLVSHELALFCHAAEGLTEIGYGHEVSAPLLARLNAAPDGRYRCLCARELARAGDHSKIDILSSLIEHGTTSEQTAAAECIFKIRAAGCQHALRHLLTETDDAMLQLMTYGALAGEGDLESFTQIRTCLQNNTPEIRKIAAWLLTRLGSSSDVAPLRMLRASESDVVVRAYVDHALAALGERTAVEALRHNLYCEITEIRQMAADTARIVDASVTMPELSGLLTDLDRDVQIRAAHAVLYRHSRTVR